MCLHFNCAFGLFLMLRKSLTLMRNTPLARILPFDQHVMFHKMAGFAVVFFTLIHTAMHLANASMFSSSCSFIPAFSGPGEWFRGVMYGVDGGKHSVYIVSVVTIFLWRNRIIITLCVFMLLLLLFSVFYLQRDKKLNLFEILFTLKAKVGWFYGFAPLSGVILDVILLIMFICSMEFVRRSGCFEVSNLDLLTLYQPFLYEHRL